MLFKSKIKYYTDIDEIPVFNWFKIQETNDLSWLLIKRAKVGAKLHKVLAEQIMHMHDQYIDAFGLSDKYRRMLELKRDIRVMEIDFFKTKNRALLTFIEVKKHELKALVGNGKKEDMGSVRVHVAKYLGTCDFKAMSVKFFYETLEEIRKEFNAKRQVA